MALMETIIGYIVLIMFLFLLLIVFIVFKPWRFLVRCSPACTIEADDLERPFIEEDFGEQPSHTYESPEVFAPEGCLLNDGLLNSSGCSLLLDISHPSENVLVGQTLKRLFVASLSAEEQQRHLKGYADSRFPLEDTTRLLDFSKNIGDQGSCLTLEVITGPSRGLSYSLRSSSTSEMPFTLGRNSPCDLVLKDSEVSGKHALIKWNSNKLTWELVDMGSLNGTLLNSKPVHHPAYGSRHWGVPVELSSGDIITLGTTSQIHVHIELVSESGAPFCIGIASDAMALRYGAKKLPMEDVLYYRWPLHGVSQFGVFGICDGHGGADAAKSASQILPDMITKILSDSFKREKVLSQKDASDVLRQAFDLTEASMNNYYEGCTATVLMVWAAGDRSFFVQCANVGDSTCIIR
ncbi:phosphatase 2C 70-like protein [Drosera capensis]